MTRKRGVAPDKRAYRKLIHHPPCGTCARFRFPFGGDDLRPSSDGASTKRWRAEQSGGKPACRQAGRGTLENWSVLDVVEAADEGPAAAYFAYG
jgi:hypothetical protein